jgi:serine/threonine protein kinase/Tfp pilus assembly protein PilF
MSPQDRQPDGERLRAWGSFRLLEKVGEGGFGEVYRAYDTVLEREVALKLLFPDSSRENESSEALREARAIAKVRHANILPVYGIDCHDGRVGIWSDFVHGKTLSSLVKAQGPFGPREVALIGIDLGKAISAVHGAGLLHRDIKASNVMREAGGRILLMDFGLTHDLHEASRICGTPPYMAPELIEGKAASVSSDLYALGALLFFLLTGKLPFEGDGFIQVREAQRAGSRIRLMDERPDLPEQMAHVIEKAMDPDPSQRFASAGQMIAALSEAAGLNSSSLISTAPVVPPKRRWWLAAVAAGLLALAGGFSVKFLPIGTRAALTSAGPQAQYLKALDLLDHYYRSHNTENAIKLLQETVAKAPGFAAAYAALGRADWRQYIDTHDSALVEPAKAACLRALELDHDMASAHVTLGMIYTEAGRTDLASEELKEALQLNRSADAYSALAGLYQKEGRSSEVEPTIQKAIDLAPGQWPYLNQLGTYYLATGNYRGAAEQFQKAAKLSPDNARALNNLGNAYRRQDRLADARAAYEESLAIEPAFNTLSNLGLLLEQQGFNEDSARVFQRAIDMNPESYVSWANLASAYNRMPGEKAKAKETYLKAISVAEAWRLNHANDPDVISELATFYAAAGKPDESLPLLRQAVALAPQNPQVLYRVAEGYELLGRRQEALQWIGKALGFGLSPGIVKRNPELANLRADPKFPTLK